MNTAAEGMVNLGPFSIARLRIPAISDATASTCYQLVVQLTPRTSVQLMCVRFDG